MAGKVTKSFNDMVKGMKHHKMGTDVPKQVGMNKSEVMGKNKIKKLFVKDKGENVCLDESFTVNFDGATLTAFWDYDSNSYKIDLTPIMGGTPNGNYILVYDLGDDDWKDDYHMTEDGLSEFNNQMDIDFDTDDISNYCTIGGSGCWGWYMDEKLHGMSDIISVTNKYMRESFAMVPLSVNIDGIEFEMENYDEFYGEIIYYADIDAGWITVGFDDLKFVRDNRVEPKGDYTITVHSQAGGTKELTGNNHGIEYACKEAVRFAKDCGVIEKSRRKSNTTMKSRRIMPMKKMFFKDEAGNNIHFDESFVINVNGYDLEAVWDYDGDRYVVDLEHIFEDDDKYYLRAIGDELTYQVYDGISSIWLELYNDEDGLSTDVGIYCDLRDSTELDWLKNITSFSGLVSSFDAWMRTNCQFVKRDVEVDGEKFTYFNDCGTEYYFLDGKDYMGCGEGMRWNACRVYLDNWDKQSFDYEIHVDSPAGKYNMNGSSSNLGDVLKEAILFFKDCGVIEKSAKKSKARKSNVKKFAHQ